MVIQETAKPQMEGMLRHLEETSGFRLRDFRLFSGPSAEPGAPPWKGKADGVIITMGLSVGETAQQVYRWLPSGIVFGHRDDLSRIQQASSGRHDILVMLI